MVMADAPEKPRPRARPWWRSRVANGGVLAVALALVVAYSFAQWVAGGAWLLALAALTVWLLAPDLAWAWREHPEVVRRTLVLLTRPRTIRVVLYVLLAYAWYVTVF